MKEVEVIATFLKDGTIKPFRFRLIEDDSFIVINISRILYFDVDRKNEYIKYKCECVVQNKMRIIDVFFYKNKFTWYVKI